jgi:hypothetical protein
MYSTPCCSTWPIAAATVLVPYLNWAHLAHGCYNHPLRIRRSRQMLDWLTLYRASDPGSTFLGHVCVFPCRRMCHGVSTMGPRACTHHAHAFDPHMLVKPRELAPIPNVTSSPNVWPRPTLPRSGATDVATRLSFRPHFAQNG